ncbi:MAG: Hint domain-containing protein [Paracoccaceae bacterium]|jgi:hypothetical protein|nr:Hint domain-containing protein [Paracoccaceae bacterium]
MQTATAQTHTGWFAAHLPGEGAITLAPRALPAQLPQGSMMLEFTLMRGEPELLPLVHLSRAGPQPRFFSLGFTAQGQITLLQRHGAAFHSISLDATDAMIAGGRMRLIWRWDATHGESLLTLEALDAGTLRQRAGSAPLPMPRDDLLTLATGAAPGTEAARIGPRVDWLALGDHLHPLGPAACFAPSTPLETPYGLRPAGSLRAGDWVQTVDAGVQQVVWSGRISLPALGNLRPVRLSAPSFGQTHDLWLLPQHRIALSGPAVEYIFGEDEVLVEARHLVDGCSALQPDRPNVLGWHGILLADHHLLIADGCRIESLNAGRLARQPALAATTALADLARTGTLPEHRHPVRRVLSGYETMTLASVRAQGRGPVAA